MVEEIEIKECIYCGTKNRIYSEKLSQSACGNCKKKLSETYYDILEISHTASIDEIKKAYRKLTMKWHPDKNPNDPNAERIFKIISDIYYVLVNPDKRKEYDIYLTNSEKLYSFSEPEKSKDESEKNYEGIKGWLILIVIGLISSSVKLFDMAFSYIVPAITNQELQVFMNSTSEYYIPLLQQTLYFELIGDLSFALFALLLLVFMFLKKKLFPLLMIIFMVSNLFFILVDDSLSKSIKIENQNLFENNDNIELIKIIIMCCIWIPYLLKSKRVKATFVK